MLVCPFKCLSVLRIRSFLPSAHPLNANQLNAFLSRSFFARFKLSALHHSAIVSEVLARVSALACLTRRRQLLAYCSRCSADGMFSDLISKSHGETNQRGRDDDSDTLIAAFSNSIRSATPPSCGQSLNCSHWPHVHRRRPTWCHQLAMSYF